MLYISGLDEMVTMVKMVNLGRMVLTISMIIMVVRDVMVTKVIIVMIIIRDKMVITVEIDGHGRDDHHG